MVYIYSFQPSQMTRPLPIKTILLTFLSRITNNEYLLYFYSGLSKANLLYSNDE
jgi:hypothetical protein